MQWKHLFHKTCSLYHFNVAHNKLNDRRIAHKKNKPLFILFPLNEFLAIKSDLFRNCLRLNAFLELKMCSFNKINFHHLHWFKIINSILDSNLVIFCHQIDEKKNLFGGCMHNYTFNKNFPFTTNQNIFIERIKWAIKTYLENK